MYRLPGALFSPSKSDNARRCRGGETPCYLCGKPIVDQFSALMVEVVDGGYWIVQDGDVVDTNDAGYCGGYPVGPGCIRKLRRAMRATGDRLPAGWPDSFPKQRT